MEPLFFKAENKPIRQLALALVGCFNGAAFFQSGKLRTTSRKTPLTSVPLQWSRFFSKRKILGRPDGKFP